VDQALFAVVIGAYLHGVSTRKVDDLVKALGADTGISKSTVSRICADLDAEVEPPLVERVDHIPHMVLADLQQRGDVADGLAVARHQDHDRAATSWRMNAIAFGRGHRLEHDEGAMLIDSSRVTRSAG
jgi:hypothetical protein